MQCCTSRNPLGCLLVSWRTHVFTLICCQITRLSLPTRVSRPEAVLFCLSTLSCVRHLPTTVCSIAVCVQNVARGCTQFCAIFVLSLEATALDRICIADLRDETSCLLPSVVQEILITGPPTAHKACRTATLHSLSLCVAQMRKEEARRPMNPP